MQEDAAYQKFTAFFHNTKIQENIRSSREEQFQTAFLRELFADVLGYTMNPKPGYELTTEFRNQKNDAGFPLHEVSGLRACPDPLHAGSY